MTLNTGLKIILFCGKKKLLEQIKNSSNNRGLYLLYHPTFRVRWQGEVDRSLTISDSEFSSETLYRLKKGCEKNHQEL